jgi:Xaa-Pro aminopeptidase
VGEQQRRRIAALVAQLPESRVDGILISSIANIRYLTGFSGSSAILIVTPQDATLITDFRYKTQVTEEVGDSVSVLIDSESLWLSLWKHLGRSAGLKVIGFESAHLPHRDFERLLEAGARWQWRPLEDMVESLRQRKDKQEVELITRAAAVATTALQKTLPHISAGMSEYTIAGILEKELREAGSEGFPFATIVATGPRSALPHARTSARTVQKGEFLLIDYGAVVDGYCSDITRTFVVGAAGMRERELYGVVRSANELARLGIKAGMKGKDADAIARSHIERAGYGAEFGHGLGHGIGLQVHESPRLSRSAEAALPTGTVVTVEPGIYIPGWGGVRIEDDVYLSTDGPKVLTHFTRDLVEIR